VVVEREPEILKIWERDRAYWKRVAWIVPISLALILSLLFWSDRISLSDSETWVGWKGEMRVLPEITVVSDDNPFSSPENEERLKVMTGLEVDVRDGPEFLKPQTVQDEESEPVAVPSSDKELQLKSELRTRRDASYSDDFVIVKMVEPEYPRYERENGIEGSVLVELLVNEAGRVETAAVLSAIGPESFKESSLAAVRQFVFLPLIRDGKSVPVWIKFHIKFRIVG
jgi:TonB family protein